MTINTSLLLLMMTMLSIASSDGQKREMPRVMVQVANICKSRSGCRGGPESTNQIPRLRDIVKQAVAGDDGKRRRGTIGGGNLIGSIAGPMAGPASDNRRQRALLRRLLRGAAGNRIGQKEERGGLSDVLPNQRALLRRLLKAAARKRMGQQGEERGGGMSDITPKQRLQLRRLLQAAARSRQSHQQEEEQSDEMSDMTPNQRALLRRLLRAIARRRRQATMQSNTIVSPAIEEEQGGAAKVAALRRQLAKLGQQRRMTDRDGNDD